MLCVKVSVVYLLLLLFLNFVDHDSVFFLFFCSGEKMCDVQWSDIAEVKGKVRLDAFEKYIQDLSRSRNRRLMVRYDLFHISLTRQFRYVYSACSFFFFRLRI